MGGGEQGDTVLEATGGPARGFVLPVGPRLSTPVRKRGRGVGGQGRPGVEKGLHCELSAAFLSGSSISKELEALALYLEILLGTRWL